MIKKIAVLGNKNLMNAMMRYTDDSVASKFVYIQSEIIISGYEFSDYILLDSWYNAYNNPREILDLVIQRIR